MLFVFLIAIEVVNQNVLFLISGAIEIVNQIVGFIFHKPHKLFGICFPIHVHFGG